MSRFILPLAALLLLGCSVASSYRLDAAKYYMPQQWLEYPGPQEKEHNGQQLVNRAMAVDRSLKDVFVHYGEPDYVRAESREALNFAYLERGTVLVFYLDRYGHAPHEVEYKRFNNLSQQLVREFARAEQLRKQQE